MPCGGPEDQFDGGFKPSVGHGGFGGGDCSATKTPLIYVHGNGDHAINFAADPAHPASGATKSVYSELKAAGYNDCELFGITYLSPTERENPEKNFHNRDKQSTIAEFIAEVLQYTGAEKVDVVTHSLGVSMTLSALKRFNKWPDVRRFISISGAIRGLNACYAVGYANAFVPTCASQNYWDSYMFGFHPDGYWSNNDWTGSSGERSMRKAPSFNDDVDFYSISAGKHDQILCSTSINASVCDEGALFEDNANVKAQLDIGTGTEVLTVDYDFTDGSVTNSAGGDLDGVGHFGSRLNAGKIIVNMLTSDCEETDCAQGYTSQTNHREPDDSVDSRGDSIVAGPNGVNVDEIDRETSANNSSGCSSTKGLPLEPTFPLIFFGCVAFRRKVRRHILD